MIRRGLWKYLWPVERRKPRIPWNSGDGMNVSGDLLFWWYPNRRMPSPKGQSVLPSLYPSGCVAVIWPLFLNARLTEIVWQQYDWLCSIKPLTLKVFADRSQSLWGPSDNHAQNFMSQLHTQPVQSTQLVTLTFARAQGIQADPGGTPKLNHSRYRIFYLVMPSQGIIPYINQIFGVPTQPSWLRLWMASQRHGLLLCKLQCVATSPCSLGPGRTQAPAESRERKRRLCCLRTSSWGRGTC